MAAVNQNQDSADSIIVSNLPSNLLLADLKALLLGHFANFGRILRISCASKARRERTAHIQFSSSDEAINASQNGTMINGHTTSITISSKRPNTQLLPSCPQPVVPSSVTSNSSTSSVFTGNGSNNRLNIQSTLTAYFKRNENSSGDKTEDKKNVKECIHRKSSISNEVPSTSTGSTASTDMAENAVGQAGTTIKDHPCTKLEVYQDPTSSRLAQNTASCKLAMSPTLSSVATQNTLRPMRSLREILNLDTSNMKIVKTTTASDALACRYLTGGSHPFPLALMFGRMPGTIIMPVKSIIDSIKPGLEIKESAVELIWNTVLSSVLRKVLPRRARLNLHESIVSKMALEKYTQLEADVINVEAMNAAETEFGIEEDTMICCEDVMEAMLGLVCSSLIEIASAEELRMNRVNKAISKAVQCCYRKLTGVVINEVVHQTMPDAVLYSLCMEAVDDFLESPIFELHVKVVAVASLKESREARNALRCSNTSSSLSSNGIGKTLLGPISNCIPPLNKAGLTENWLNTSQFSHIDSQLSNAHSSVETDISCSVGSTQSSVSSHSSSLTDNSGRATAYETIKHEETLNDLQAGEQKPQGFLSSLSINSLKRKAAAVWSNFSPLTIPVFRFKKRKVNSKVAADVTFV